MPMEKHTQDGLFNVYVKRVSLTGKEQLNVNVDFCIYYSRLDHVTKNNYRILMVQVTDPKTVADLQNLSQSALAARIFRNRRRYDDFMTYDLRGNTNSVKSDQNYYEYSMCSDEKNRFNVNTSSKKNLVYIFVPYLETDNADSENVILGKPTIEVVIENNQVKSQGTAFLLPNGEYWYGPVHRNPSKGYMAGAKHSSAPHPVVTAKRVFNSTIMDHRVLRQLDELASFDTGTTKCKVPKFGDIYFSRDNSDRTRYIFGINFYEIARTASEHSWLFKNPAVGRSLTKGTKIVSLKLLRSLAQESKGVTKLNIPKSNYAVNGIILNNTPQVVVTANEKTPGRLSPAINSVLRDQETTSTIIGNISEPAVSTFSNHIRFFSGADYEVSEYNSGKYQYGVEITVEDASTKYLRAKFEQARQTYKLLKDYYNLATDTTSPNLTINYSSKSKRFKDSFIRQIQKSKKINDKALHTAIKTYLVILSQFSGNPQIAAAKTTNQVYNLVHPQNATPETIASVVKSVELLVSKIEKLLIKPEKSLRAPGNSPSRTTVSPDNRISTFSTWFEARYDAEVTPKTGYDYLDPSFIANQQKEIGLPTVTRAQLKSQTQQQTQDLFSATQAFSLTKNLNVELKNSMVGYLTPARVKLPTGEEYSFLDRSSDFYNLDVHNKIMSSMLIANRVGSVEGKGIILNNLPRVDATGKSKLTRVQQELRKQLIELYAHEGCTVESIGSYRSKDSGTAAIPWWQRPTADTQNIVDKDIVAKIDETYASSIRRVKEDVGLKNDSANPNSVLMQLIDFEDPVGKRGIILNNRPSPDVNFDLQNPKSVYNQISQTELDSAPNPVKALMTLYTLDKKDNKKTNIDLSKLKGTRKDQLGWIYNNFLNIMEVQVLTGYQTLMDGSTDVSSPIFKTLSGRMTTGGTMLCRLRKYSKVDFGVKDLGIDYPVYNSVFFMQSAAGPGSAEAQGIILNNDPRPDAGTTEYPWWVRPTEQSGIIGAATGNKPRIIGPGAVTTAGKFNALTAQPQQQAAAAAPVRQGRLARTARQSRGAAPRAMAPSGPGGSSAGGGY